MKVIRQPYAYKIAPLVIFTKYLEIMEVRRGIPDEELLAIIMDLRSKRDQLSKKRREESKRLGINLDMGDEEREIRSNLINLDARKNRRTTIAKIRGVKK
jgi:hypothetical protein